MAFRPQFGLQTLILFILLAGSCTTAIVRRQPWAVRETLKASSAPVMLSVLSRDRLLVSEINSVTQIIDLSSRNKSIQVFEKSRRVAFIPWIEPHWIVAESLGGKIFVYSTDNGNSFPIDIDQSIPLNLSIDGNSYLTSREGALEFVYHNTSPQKLSKYKSVTHVCFSLDSKVVAICYQDSIELASLHDFSRPTLVHVNSPVSAIIQFRDGFAVGLKNGDLALIFPSGEYRRIGHTTSAPYMLISNGGKYVACLQFGGALEIVSTDESTLGRRFSAEIPRSAVFGADLFGDNRRVAFCSSNGIHIFNINDNKALAEVTWEFGNDAISVVCDKYNPSRIITGCADGSIKILEQRFPEEWWGHVYRPEIWTSIVLSILLAWRLVPQRTGNAKIVKFER